MDDLKKDINLDSFSRRHIGSDNEEITSMLSFLGFKDIDTLIDSIIPKNILDKETLNIGEEITETEALKKIKEIATKNIIFKSYLGQGYFNTITPSVISRNVFENPGWYTSYTPYQPEISQGRLEALINFQTMVSDLTNMSIANASLLDEATAAAEAMTLAKRVSKSNSDTFFVDEKCYPQTINIIHTRAKPLGIKVKIGSLDTCLSEKDYFAVLVQYPDSIGEIKDFSSLTEHVNKQNALAIFATDLLALTLIKPPGECGADIVIGSSQRFGVPLGFGGPHAAFIATKDDYKRSLPGRIVGASVDSHGQLAYRLALQTREQHIRREKATSNICTAQALLAIMAGFYAIYHGPKGLKNIAEKINDLAIILANRISTKYSLRTLNFFDTLSIITNEETDEILNKALNKNINLRKVDKNTIGISLDETTTDEDINIISALFVDNFNYSSLKSKSSIPTNLLRESKFLQHPVFHKHQTETEMMRYIRQLYDKDIALDRSMIPLGSCTMKLNSASEMLPVSWPEFSSIHPFAPFEQVKGYQQLSLELQDMLISITGYEGISLQPNAGSQGEYAGLLAINAFHKNNREERKVCLIPTSAHGTNPASAQMVGMQVMPVDCDSKGNIDIKDLEEKASKYSKNLAAIMITYPSTHGVFESSIKEVCKIVHENGGLVYIDGANFNAMVGLCYPGKFGGDVSHLNLHKTFCIPHGGGGPGIGPIAVGKNLIPFMPSKHEEMSSLDESRVGAVSGSNLGSASILPISWMYIKMMGSNKLRKASQIAILNANYIAKRLKDHYPILYKGDSGLVAHECIIDLRPLKESSGIEVEDVAKRLIDYGFHAPTMSWPVTGTLMIEPTESESKDELDRFCEAMMSIRTEIKKIESGESDKYDNLLKNAPHTAFHVTKDEWTHKYSRKEAAYPLESLMNKKYWPPVGRVDNVYGDRNLMCSCPSMEDFKEET